MTGYPMRRPVTVLLTHPPEALANYYGERALAALREIAEVRLNPRDRVLAPDELVEAAVGCAIVISDRQTPGCDAIFARLPDLVAFGRVAVDIRNIDVEAASAAGVLVTQASRGFMDSVAEWIVGAMIAAGRHMVDYASDYRAGRVPVARIGTQLKGSTLGVIGYGAIAARLCEIALALGMRVLVHDPYKSVPAPLVGCDFARLLAEADFVVPLAVATPETENLIDAAALGRMKPTAWLVNASRGNLVNEEALAEVLDRGRIAGAALDVGRAPDQMPTPAIAARLNVIATPHMAGLTRPAIEHQAVETARQAAAIIRGELPVGAVNADRAERFARYAAALHDSGGRHG